MKNLVPVLPRSGYQIGHAGRMRVSVSCILSLGWRRRRLDRVGGVALPAGRKATIANRFHLTTGAGPTGPAAGGAVWVLPGVLASTGAEGAANVRVRFSRGTSCFCFGFRHG